MHITSCGTFRCHLISKKVDEILDILTSKKKSWKKSYLNFVIITVPVDGLALLSNEIAGMVVTFPVQWFE